MGSGSAGVQSITRTMLQMKGIGVVQMGELNQLSEQGINGLQLLAQATGRSTAEIRKSIEKGEIGADEFIAAFQRMSQQRFGGMMEQQARTMEGAMSTIRDTIGMGAAPAFSPFFEATRDAAVRLADFLQTDQFAAWVARIQAGAQTAVTWLQTNLPAAIAILSNAWTTTLLPAMEGVWAWIQSDAIPGLERLQTWINTNLPPAIENLAGIWETRLKPAIEGVLGAIGPVATAFATVADPVAAGILRELDDTFVGIAAAVATLSVPTLAAAAVSFGAMAVAAGLLWLLAGAVGVLAFGISKNGPAIGDFFATFGQHFPDRVRELLRWVQVAGEALRLLGTPGKLGALVGSGQVAPMVSNWMEGRTQAELKDWRSGPVFGADTGIPPLPPSTMPTAPSGGASVTQNVNLGTVNINSQADADYFFEQLAGLEAQALATAGTAGLPGAD